MVLGLISLHFLSALLYLDPLNFNVFCVHHCRFLDILPFFSIYHLLFNPGVVLPCCYCLLLLLLSNLPEVELIDFLAFILIPVCPTVIR